MSIRLRLTLLYSAILALTLIVFGTALYTIQARSTMDVLKGELTTSGNNIATALLWRHLHQPPAGGLEPDRPPPQTFEGFFNDPALMGLREREIVRVLSEDGVLVASSFGTQEDALPLNEAGLQAVQNDQAYWEISTSQGGRLLIYNQPVVANGEVFSIIQVARPLTERDRSLANLRTTLIVASVLVSVIAFGIGWVLSGTALNPIHRITNTAQMISAESDFSQRVDYSGPNDEVGQLAKTFNSMLSRLQQSYQRVSQTLKMQRDFVADVSHELRSPLTTVRGNLELLSHDPPLPASEQADILQDVVGESDRLIRLVNDLLLLARADAGRSLIQEPISVRPLIEEVCHQARQLDDEREITADSQDLTIQGDRDALKQVLLILLDNALKHTRGAIQVASEAQDAMGLIRVIDDGSGIPPEKLARLFDRFYRGEVNPEVPGFGLGLPIAKSLMEGQGGSIEVENRTEGGTEVRLKLPLVIPNSH